MLLIILMHSVQVIDRRSAVFKLAQGVFVAPAPLEELYGRCPLLASVFVFGHPSMTAVAVAAVPAPGVGTDEAAAQRVLAVRLLILVFTAVT